jgi:polyvinyl alcohol dehydrogenase (cytochrome)
MRAALAIPVRTILFACAAALLLLAALFPASAAPGDDSPALSEDEWKGSPADKAPPGFEAGAEIYRTSCAGCHDQGNGRTPHYRLLHDMTPRAIHAALVDGAMQAQGAALSAEQKVAVAEFITLRRMAANLDAPEPKMCEGANARFDRTAGPAFSNWGLSEGAAHFIPADIAGIGKQNLSTLKLKWAYAFPDSQRMRSQPALAGGAIILGNHTGEVHALDRETGCVRWVFKADAEVRTGIVASDWDADDADAQPLVWFGDLRGNVYAVKLFTGKLAWRVRANDHPASVITGTPSLHEGTLYVPVSSLEEAAAAAPGYICCTFRGSMLALDARTGEEKWRTWLVGEPGPQGEDGTAYGPSGVAVWNSPAIDARRGQLTVATGDNYSEPASDLSDAIVALDLETGAIRWHFQALEGDIWNVDCIANVAGNCPDDAGPDFDFGAGTVLATGKDGRELVLAGQKSGIVYAVDPDTGEKVWQTRAGRGGIGGGIVFGLAATGGTLFVPMFDMPDGKASEYPHSPGIHAIDIATGKFVWRSVLDNRCKGIRGCAPGYAGSASVTPDLLMIGGDDGHMRIYDTANGDVLWDLDTKREFETVNGVPGRGGAISGGAAPIAHDGQLIFVSGYGFASRLGGNVLLVYEAE